MADEITNACGTLKTSRKDLLARDNVVATGVGYKLTNNSKTDTASIVCSVARKLPLNELPMAARVPDTIAWTSVTGCDGRSPSTKPPWKVTSSPAASCASCSA